MQNKNGLTININYQDGKTLPSSFNVYLYEGADLNYQYGGGNIYNKESLISAHSILSGAIAHKYAYILALQISINYFTD